MMSNNGVLARIRRSEGASGLAIISPSAIYAFLLLAAPLATVLLFSVLMSENGQIVWQFSLSNYETVFTHPVYRAIMLRSLMVSMMVTLATVLLAYPLAYYISFHVPAHRKSMWLFLVTLPFWTSYIIRVSLWRVILGYNGVIDSALMDLGLIDEPLNILSNGVASIVITLAHAYAPFAILPIFVALEKVDRSLLEAGQDLGESKLRTFWRVTLPLSMPGVIAAVLIVFIPTVGDYVTPELIGGGKVPMIANMIESQLLKQRDQALGSALSVTVMMIVAVVSIIFLLLNRRFLGGQK
jgi:spermidine/putrescine transport system permease protein